MVSACGDPLRGIERYSEVEDVIEVSAERSEALPDPAEAPEDTFLSRLWRRSASEPDVPAVVLPRPVASTGDVAVNTATDQPEAAPDSTARRRIGLFSRLIAGARETEDSAATTTGETARTAAVAPERPGSSSFAGGSGRTESEIEVPYGTLLPYGVVARVCGARFREMGRRIDRSPARGRGYALFDSNPGSSQPRTYYLTGFADDCPRQFTAANAVFGSAEMHELLRYGRPADLYPYSETDKAYENIKRDVCGVGRKKPCGARMNRLEKRAVFVSTYEQFAGTGRWSDILIHDGEVVAFALKRGN